MQKGNILTGHPVSVNKFQGISTLDELQQYGLRRPSMVESARKGDSQQDLDAKQMHEEMNRRFDAARIRRAIDYRDYIHGVEMQGLMGGTPAVTLWFNAQLEETEGGILLPYNKILTAIDGETQTEARYMLRDGITSGKVGRVTIKADEVRTAFPESGATPFAITLYHGISREHAQQILKDYNAEAHPIDAKKAATYDHVGPLSVAVGKVVKTAGFSMDDVNRTGKVAGKRSAIAYEQILMGLAGYVLNGANPTPVTPAALKLMNRPHAAEVSQNGVIAIAELVRAGGLKNANSIIWQAAGHKLSHGQKALNIQAGMAAYDGTKQAGRGGPRMAPRARLAAIISAL